jgi:hypothetical protein
VPSMIVSRNRVLRASLSSLATINVA